MLERRVSTYCLSSPSLPVLLAIDDFQALYTLSMYRDPYFKMVKAYHLTLPRTLLEFASGKQSFVRSSVYDLVA